MAIVLPGGFDIKNNEPADARISLADQTARLGLSVANVYEGLIVYQQDNNILYVLNDASDPSVAGNWSEVGSGSAEGTYYAEFPEGIVVTGSILATDNITASNNIYAGTNITASNNIYVGNLAGIGTTSPVSPLHVYENTSTTSTAAGLIIEQDGFGDAKINFVKTGATTWSVGIDNDDNTFKIASGSEFSTTEIMSIDAANSVIAFDFANNDFRIQTSNNTNENIAIGHNARLDATAGDGTVAIGPFAARNQSGGNGLVAIGQYAGRYNAGNYNIAIGGFALFSEPVGGSVQGNTAIGHQALTALQTGSYNHASGYFSFGNLVDGSFNFALGSEAGRYYGSYGGTNLTQATSSIFIGTRTVANGNSQENQIVIGHETVGKGSNTTTIGNSSTTATYLAGTVSASGYIGTPIYMHFGLNSALQNSSGTQMTTVNGSTNGQGYEMPLAGEVTHITIQLEVTTLDSGQTVSATLYKNGTTTSKSVSVDVSSTGDAGATAAITPESYSAGDALTVFLSTSAATSITNDHASILRVVET